MVKLTIKNRFNFTGLKSAIDRLWDLEARRKGPGDVYISFQMTLSGTCSKYRIYTPDTSHQEFAKKSELIEYLNTFEYDPIKQITKELKQCQEQLAESRKEQIDIKAKIEKLKTERDGLIF